MKNNSSKEKFPATERASEAKHKRIKKSNKTKKQQEKIREPKEKSKKDANASKQKKTSRPKEYKKSMTFIYLVLFYDIVC